MVWGWTTPFTLFLLGLLAERTSLSVAFHATGVFVALLVGLLWIWAKKRLPSDSPALSSG
jgi:hypothetical protein